MTRDAAPGRVRVTIVMEYAPEPESYPNEIADDALSEMAKYDEQIFLEGAIAVEDMLEWGEILSVEFEAVQHGR